MQTPMAQQMQPYIYPMPNYQQPGLDTSVLSSNDSGMIDSGVYMHQGYQPSMQYYSQPSVPIPMYFAQSPIPQTPQIAQVAPIYPIAQHPQMHMTNSGAQTPIATVAPLQVTAPNESAEANSAENA